MKMRILGVLLCVSVVLSCAEPPVDRMTRARQALAELGDDLQAERWAPDALDAARSAVESAEEEVAVQDRRLPWSRDYEKASARLSLAKQDLAYARTAAMDAKLEAEEMAREALETASYALVHARAALLVAPAARRGSSSRRVDRHLSGIEGRLDEVRNLIVTEDFPEAVTLAEEILESVSFLLSTVNGASPG